MQLFSVCSDLSLVLSSLYSLAAKLFAHAMVELEHAFVASQIELVVVSCVFAKANRSVFVDDASDLDHLAHC